MNQDIVVKTTTTTYGSRLGGSVVTAIGGVLIVGGSIALTWWNEHRTRRTGMALGELARRVVSVTGYSADNDGKIVHYSDDLSADDNAQDDEVDWLSQAPGRRGEGEEEEEHKQEEELDEEAAAGPGHDDQLAAAGRAAREEGIRHNNLVVERKVEMYQWQQVSETQTKNKVGGSQEKTTTYKYKKAWLSSWQDASKFELQAGHENPEMPLKSQTFKSTGCHVGDFDVPDSVLESCCAFNRSDARPHAVTFGGHTAVRQGQWYYIVSSEGRLPQIGDVRVCFRVVPSPLGVTVIGRQDGTALAGFTVGEGDELEAMSVMSSRGRKSKQEMLATARSGNTIMCKLIRVVGLLGSFIGYRLVLDPLVTGAMIVPALGGLVGMGAGLLSVTPALLTAGLTTTFAWLHARAKSAPAKAAVKAAFVTVLTVSIGFYAKFAGEQSLKLASKSAETVKVGVKGVVAFARELAERPAAPTASSTV